MGKFIDERGRIFGKISIIDIIVLILAIILVCAIYVRTSQHKVAKQNEAMEKVSYVVEVGNIKDETADAVRPGDKLYDQDSGVSLGTIKEAKKSPAHKIAQKIDGTYVDGEVQGRSNLTMVVEAECRISGGRYYSERTAEISVNTEKDVQTKYAMFTGCIAEIQS